MAIAASMALPPAASTAAPTWLASTFCEATTPRRPATAGLLTDQVSIGAESGRLTAGMGLSWKDADGGAGMLGSRPAAG